MQAIVSALEAIRPQGDFCVRLSVPVDDLQIRVGDAPPLAFPLAPDVARALISQARPAKFGWKDQTLQDSSVRNTWEIPKSRVKIDKRRWNKTLHPLLEQIKTGLGLGEDAKLSASLHNLLIYQKGQFFRAHQDSEKEDGMVATLVVVLPCSHTGGSLVVDHSGVKKRVDTSRAARDKLTCVAFYADCHHEVKPVNSGYRVVLTYNLILKDAARKVVIPAGDAAVVTRLTQALRDYFDQRADEVEAQAADARRAPTPPKLVYLLDHQYTEKSLSWHQLKSGDRLRAEMIAQAAARLDLERYIALADIQEIWNCESYYDDRYYRSRRRYRYYEDEDEAFGGEEDYLLSDLIESSISLRHWTSATREPADFSGLLIGDNEVCWTTPTDQFDPFSSEYEGYMGNYGNTLERWYHRAAIVLWRKEDHYAMLCEVDPKQLVEDLRKLAKEPATRTEARSIIASVMPYWSRAINGNRDADDARTQSVLDLALQIDLPEMAQDLVSPFSLRVLNAETAKAFMVLEQRYGTPWAVHILEQWSQHGMYYQRHDLIKGLCPLISALYQMGQTGDSGKRKDSGKGVIDWLLHHQFDILVENHAGQQRYSPANLEAQCPERVESAGELLNACVAAGNAEMHKHIADYLVNNETLYDPLELAELTLRLERIDSETQAWGHRMLRQHAVDKLTDEFNKPERKKNDWAIAQTTPCNCADCATLNAYLQASSEREKVWPLAKARRSHIHQMIGWLGVPVAHQTRREGSPHRLVLTKTDDLFKHEAARRKRVKQALDKLSDAA